MKKKYISFSHHGNLPAFATVRVFVGDVYNNGNKLYLYYYNEDTKEVEFIDKDITVKDSYAEFKINHCSEYFLTSAIVNSAKNNPNYGKYVIIILSLIIFILLAVTLFFK